MLIMAALRKIHTDEQETPETGCFCTVDPDAVVMPIRMAGNSLSNSNGRCRNRGFLPVFVPLKRRFFWFCVDFMKSLEFISFHFLRNIVK